MRFRTTYRTIVFLCLCMAGTGEYGSAQTIPRKDTLTMLITDSGLGGLSVCGRIEQLARRRGDTRVVNLVFCNALDASGRGYNDMKGMEEKASVFSRALSAMETAVHPDVVLIACNTLSVVYPHTRYAAATKIPVVEIVGVAAGWFAEELTADPGASLLIFGTETTIASGAHRDALISRGIAPGRIGMQACPKLETEIQADPASDLVSSYVAMYAEEGAGRIPAGSGQVLAGLCCTHYGYVDSLFVQALHQAGRTGVRILNPNDRMAELVFAGGEPRPQGEFRGSVRVLSAAALSPEEVASIAGVLRAAAPLTATALERYERRPDMFSTPEAGQ